MGLLDRPPFFYINKPVLGHSNEFPLLMIFFHNKQKTQRPQLHPDCGGGLGQKWYQNWNRRFTTVATMSSDLTGHTGKAEFSEVQCACRFPQDLCYVRCGNIRIVITSSTTGEGKDKSGQITKQGKNNSLMRISGYCVYISGLFCHNRWVSEKTTIRIPSHFYATGKNVNVREILEDLKLKAHSIKS